MKQFIDPFTRNFIGREQPRIIDWNAWLARQRRTFFWPLILAAGALAYSLYTGGKLANEIHQQPGGWPGEIHQTGHMPVGVTTSVRAVSVG